MGHIMLSRMFTSTLSLRGKGADAGAQHGSRNTKSTVAEREIRLPRTLMAMWHRFYAPLAKGIATQ
jgi:hypothetical protein